MSSKIVNKTSGKSDNKTIYRIEKDCSINNIEQIKSELAEIVESKQPFMLELKNIEVFDLTAIQLLKTLENELNENFSYQIDIKEEQKGIFVHSGFEYIFKR